MSSASIHNAFRKAEKLANTSKIGRFFSNPIKYLTAIGYRQLFYPKNKKGKLVKAQTYFDSEMQLVLPAGIDIYLTGCKSHDSEIRLAKFLMNTLQKGDTLFDIGAHFGYFSLLGAKLVGEDGKVIAFEAAKNTFEILRQNTQQTKNIKVLNRAVSDQKGLLRFYEFPVLYSEYNSLEIDQFKNTSWYQTNQPEQREIEAIALDDYYSEKGEVPKVIKIDVEGAEFAVIRGAKNLLSNHSPQVVIEFLHSKRHNEAHINAKAILNNLGYQSFLINSEGELEICEEIEDYLNKKGLDSDNIIFQKSNKR